MPQQPVRSTSKPGMNIVKVLAIVAGALAVAVGAYLARARVSGSTVAAVADKPNKARSALPAEPIVKTNSRRGMAACQKVEAAGIGSDCQAFEKMVRFRIPSAPDGSGAVLTFDDPVVYKMFFSSLVKENSDSAFGSPKARTVVILTGVQSAELQAKTKAVVDAL